MTDPAWQQTEPSEPPDESDGDEYEDDEEAVRFRAMEEAVQMVKDGVWT